MALAEALQIPVATSLNGKDSIPGTHRSRSALRQLFARSANRVVNRADLVCFIGSETGGMTTHFWACRRSARPRSRSTSIRKRSGATIRWSRWSTATPR
jgi:acetolactate synthase-1/2/3 large subunit